MAAGTHHFFAAQPVRGGAFVDVPPVADTTTEPSSVDATIAGTLGHVSGAASVALENDITAAGTLGGVTGAASMDVGYAPHRYWRIYVTAGATAFPDVGEEWTRLKMMEAGVEVATSSMAWSASSTFSGYGASKVSNPPTAPGWASNFSGFPVWIKVDLGVGNAKTIDEIKLTPASATRAPGDFTVEFSDDDSSYTAKGTYNLITGWTNGVERTISVP